MPRGARPDAPGAVHHVMLRGIDGHAVFGADADRRDLLARLAAILPESGVRCFGWAVMTNHLHMLLQTGQVPMSRVMLRLNTGFAQAYNRRRDRHGYVFQDRFRSRLVEDEADLIGLVRYVHVNPLRAGLVRSIEELERFPWCGHGAVVGRRPTLPFESVSATLSLFADEPVEARRSARSWLADCVGNAPIPAAAPSSQSELDALFAAACAWLGAPRSILRTGSRLRAASRVRALAAYLAVVEGGFPGVQVAEALGVGRSAVVAGVRRGAILARELGMARPAPSVAPPPTDQK